MQDEFRVEVTVRVIPWDTNRKQGSGQAEGVFSYEKRTTEEAARLIELLVKAYETAFERTDR